MANLSLKQKIYVVVWKSVILRRRSPILSVCECICPLIIVFLAYKINKIKTDVHQVASNPQFIITPPQHVREFLIWNGTFAYTPSNAQTDKLINGVVDGINELTLSSRDSVMDLKLTTKAFDSEDQLESWLKEQKQPSMLDYFAARYLGVVFLEVNPENKILKYKIRACDESGLVTYKTKTGFSEPYTTSSFLATQLWIDFTFLKSVGIIVENVLIGTLPLTIISVNDMLIFFLYIFLSFAYVFFVLLLSKNVIQEKETGIKEITKIMGMSSCMVWSHWLVYSLLVQLPVTVALTVILTVLEPHVLAISPLVVWYLLSLFVVNCIVFIFAVSCLFSTSIKGTTIIVFGWICLHFATVQHLVQSDPDGLGFLVESLACLILPSFNIVNCFQIILSFEDHGIKWTLGLLFHKGFSSSLSIGITILIFLSSTCVYALITLFLDAVHPGPYGVAKSINCMCIWPRRRDYNRTDDRNSLPKTYEPPPKNAKVGIEIRRLQKTYGICKKIVAVRNVDLDIYEGEIMALLGHNGAGKTTTMSMITGMFSPTGGTIRVNGEDINSGASQFRHSLGLCPQQDIYFPKLTVIEHLVFFAMLKGLPREYSKVHGMQILTMLGMADKENARVGDLSGGMKRRLCLAISLSGNPRVLILDEPTSGLDPENRRKIWDIVLGMRGQRTILITTHFMEEADVLGDRIAIMDKGQVVCCGTTMFLKKLYGAGYQVHLLLKNSDVSATEIAKFVNQNYNGERVKSKAVSPTQVAFVLKENNVDSFPALFSALERSKDSLGITGMSVTCSTMEDVFLNVANMAMFDERLDDNPKEQKLSNESRTSNDTYNNQPINRLAGLELFIQRLSTLIFKRFIYLRRNFMSFLVKFVITSLMIVLMARSDVKLMSEESVQPLKINLDLYPQALIPIAYDAISENISHTAANYIRKHKIEVELLPKDTQIYTHAEKLATEDKLKYETSSLLGLSFFDSNYTVLYKELGALHLPAVAANLMANILLHLSEGPGSIETTNHPYTSMLSAVCTNVKVSVMIMAIKWWFIFTVVLIIMMMEFVPFVIDERSSGFKHQQYLAGVSPLLYWLATFISDFLVYLLAIVVYLLIIVIFGSHLLAWNSKWMGLLALVLILNGISGLFFLYLFSILFSSMVTGSSLFLMFNVAFSLIASFIMIFVFFLNFAWRLWLVVTLALLILNPMFSVSMCIAYISVSAVQEYACEKCEFCDFMLGEIVQMPTNESKQVILHYVFALAMLWLLYLVVILIFDYGFTNKIKMLFCYKRNESQEEEEYDDEDEDVRVERALARLYRDVDDYSLPLRIEGLDKRYCFGPKAVNNVTFVVEHGECFGLLGVNGAGKTTTFRMITGETMPNGGDALILSDSVVRDRRRYMRHVGYCPQFDAVLACLTGRETLWLVARLRGVRPAEVRTRVDQWLTTLGFEEHADKRSATYSGGTRRKLSTAAAFIGDPVVVFLDEPTTGVDPAARRMLWNVLQGRKQAGQSIVLTSHSMEECEALCSRLTILVAGRMVCIGSCEYLKSKFSQGYNVLLKISGNASPLEREAVKRSFTRLYQRSVVRDEHQTLVSYQVADPSIPLSQLFANMLRLSSKQEALEDFSVSNTTLEQLFLSFAQQKKSHRNLPVHTANNWSKRVRERWMKCFQSIRPRPAPENESPIMHSDPAYLGTPLLGAAPDNSRPIGSFPGSSKTATVTPSPSSDSQSNAVQPTGDRSKKTSLDNNRVKTI